MPSGRRLRSSKRVSPSMATFWQMMLMVGRSLSSSSLRTLSCTTITMESSRSMSCARSSSTPLDASMSGSTHFSSHSTMAAVKRCTPTCASSMRCSGSAMTCDTATRCGLTTRTAAPSELSVSCRLRNTTSLPSGSAILPWSSSRSTARMKDCSPQPHTSTRLGRSSGTRYSAGTMKKPLAAMSDEELLTDDAVPFMPRTIWPAASIALRTRLPAPAAVGTAPCINGSSTQSSSSKGL
mmetsp:Transcript_37963/g.96005  ORF Transcript_37963/g.96005 Transcript_37963/m.96005 type:complete len:238 (+) Transcript_37963:416-1129(+)